MTTVNSAEGDWTMCRPAGWNVINSIVTKSRVAPLSCRESLAGTSAARSSPTDAAGPVDNTPQSQHSVAEKKDLEHCQPNMCRVQRQKQKAKRDHKASSIMQTHVRRLLTLCQGKIEIHVYNTQGLFRPRRMVVINNTDEEETVIPMLSHNN